MGGCSTKQGDKDGSHTLEGADYDLASQGGSLDGYHVCVVARHASGFEQGDTVALKCRFVNNDVEVVTDFATADEDGTVLLLSTTLRPATGIMALHHPSILPQGSRTAGYRTPQAAGGRRACCARARMHWGHEALWGFWLSAPRGQMGTTSLPARAYHPRPTGSGYATSARSVTNARSISACADGRAPAGSFS